MVLTREAGATGGDVWDRWNKGMVKSLVENQCANGDDSGSWPIVGEFSSEWGRVGQTALGCLSQRRNAEVSVCQ